MTRVALIHALFESIAPINAAFDRHWPQADRMNLLDDSLSRDRASDGALTPAMTRRFVTLGRYARDQGAQAILFTCSAFGLAIDAVAADLGPIPVHKPNSAMIAQALAMGGKIGLLASFEPTLESLRLEFPTSTDLVPRHCAGALEALQAGDPALHDQIATDTALAAFGNCDVIALAQFSLARAAPLIARATGKPVLTTPEAAVQALKASI